MIMNDELFFAWLDGELDAKAAAEVESQVAADPDLQRKAAAHQALKARLQGAFAPLASEALPDTILQSTERGTVVDLAAARERKSSRLSLPAAAQWAAMAATLVLGLVAGSMIGGNSDTSTRNDAGQLIASGELDRALDTRLASAPAAAGARIGLTFRDKAGSICRSFTDGAAQGLACRDGEDWALRAVLQSADSGSGDFRMATGADPALAALIDSAIAGEPFDSAAERTSLTNGWR